MASFITRARMSNVAVSMVVDSPPLLQRQAWLLLHTLAAFGAPETMQVHVTACGPLARPLRDKITTTGAQLHLAEPFASGPGRYCNKLRQLEALASCGAEHLMLCDADVAFLSDPREAAIGSKIRAKIVDIPNPAPEILAELLKRAGFKNVGLDAQPDFDCFGRTTHRLNCNGGLYVVPAEHLPTLAPAWERHARACLASEDTLGDKLLHSDQLAFMLAMLETGLPFDPLGVEWNFPTHLAPVNYIGHENVAPKALHYHRQMSRDGKLLPPPAKGAARAVAEFNAAHAGARADPGFGALCAACYEMA
ncbi:hypothetical protein [Roseivivax marinus]|uniref:hypothetical protein n=1 Tax=Roseivivax marinus TaxID=1379903 RepID=UPI00273E8DC6|nr:hypothetical protein [Roseivivax marinus]